MLDAGCHALSFYILTDHKQRVNNKHFLACVNKKQSLEIEYSASSGGQGK